MVEDESEFGGFVLGSDDLRYFRTFVLTWLKNPDLELKAIR
jgi:hypothetical protein